jgi:competence protein ComEC
VHQSIYFRTALIIFLGAVTCASFFILPSWMVPALAVGGIACLAYAPRPRAALAGVMFLSTALGLHRYASVRSDDTVLYHLASAKVQAVISGYIDSDAKPSKSGWSIYVHATAIGEQSIDERFLIRGAGPYLFRSGDGVQVSGRLGLATRFDDFDYPAYLRKEGVRAVMIHPKMEAVPLHVSTLRRGWIFLVSGTMRVRDIFIGSVRRSVSEPAASYLVGILVGGRAALPQTVVDAFSRTSTSHILAISGYNITILATAVMTVLASRMGRRKAAFGATMIIVVFVIMTGASASVVRAALMGVFLLLSSMMGRAASVEIAMLLSGALMVFINPLIVRDDIGFQLSFAALGGLVWLEPIITRRLGKFGASRLGRLVAPTTAAQLAVFPLLLYYFHSLSVIGPLANVLVLPFVPLAMALGFATGLLGLALPSLAHALGLLAWVVATYQLSVVRWLAALPWSAFEIIITPGILASLYAILVIWWHVEQDQKPFISLVKSDTMAVQ